MLELLTGTGLALAAGLNAWIPLVVLGSLDRFTGLVEPQRAGRGSRVRIGRRRRRARETGGTEHPSTAQ